MKNILLVGGAGYVGGAVSSELYSKNYNLKVYDNLLYEDSYLKDIDFIYGDIRDKKKLKKSLNWADVVIWMAAIVGDGACDVNKENTIDINQNTVKWLSKNYDGKIIFFSTCSVYGAQNGILDESCDVNPLSLYAQTKLESEKYLSKKNSIIFRLGTLFGISDTYSRLRMDLVVNLLTIKAYFNKELTIFGGDQYRPLLHVKDVARAVVQSIKFNKTGIFNLKYDNYKISDLAHLVQKNFKENIKIKTTKMMFQDTRNYMVSSNLFDKSFNFKPKYDVNYGINEILELIKSNRIKNFDDIRYTNYLYIKKHGINSKTY